MEQKGCLATPDFPACCGHLKETVGGTGASCIPAQAKIKPRVQQACPGLRCVLSSRGQLDGRQPLHSWSMHASEHHRTVGFAKCMLEIEASKEDGARGRSLQSALRKGPLLHGDVMFAQGPRWRDLCERQFYPICKNITSPPTNQELV